MKELILIASLLGSNLAYSGLFSKNTDPVLRVLDTGDIVKITPVKKSKDVEIRTTGLNIHSDSVADLIEYVEEMKSKKLTKRKKTALILELFTDPPLKGI